jgi:hypothetical protein
MRADAPSRMDRNRDSARRSWVRMGRPENGFARSRRRESRGFRQQVWDERQRPKSAQTTGIPAFCGFDVRGDVRHKRGPRRPRP